MGNRHRRRAVQNAKENAERNHCDDLRFDCGDIDLVVQKAEFDAIFANINKNILKAHMATYFQALKADGHLLLSGFFDSDVQELLKVAKEFGGQEVEVYTREHWAAILLQKNN